MDKRREIPAAKPMAASRADTDRVIARIESLGLKVEDAVEAAGYKRATYFRLKKYEASVGTVRDLDEWLVKEESKRKKPGTPTGSEREALLAEWAELGERLMESAPDEFARMFEGLRVIAESVELRTRGFALINRVVPRNDR